MPDAPDPATADYLRSEGLRAVASFAGAAAFGLAAVESSARCAFDARADTETEGARQIAFLGPPRVIESLRVSGLHSAFTSRAVTLTADVEGYRAGATVFVIQARELEGDDATELRVIRRLA